MTKKITIEDVAREAGVGRATVDRVLNQRTPVKAETEQRVMLAVKKLGYRMAYPSSTNESSVSYFLPPSLGFILPPAEDSFYQLLVGSILQTIADSGILLPSPKFSHLPISDVDDVAGVIIQMAKEVDVIGIVALDDPKVTHAINQVTQQGVRVFTLISPLSPCGESGFVGIDSRQAGRTAALMVDKLKIRSDKIAIYIGDNRFICQETCEISFRSYLRQNQPDLILLEPIKAMEDNILAEQLTDQLLDISPDVAAIYVPCGGSKGIVSSLKKSGKNQEVLVISHGPYPEWEGDMIDGTVDFMIYHDLNEFGKLIFNTCVQHARSETGEFVNKTLPFRLVTRENLRVTS